MRTRLVELMGVAMLFIAVVVFLKLAPVAGQTPTASATAATAGPVPGTPWGEPDLQGIWTEQFDTPLQRPARFANKEFFTDDERAQLDKQRAALLNKQSDQANRIYYEPRCYEGNYGFPSLMLSARMEEAAFAEGKGPDPATKDSATDFVGVEENPLQ